MSRKYLYAKMKKDVFVGMRESNLKVNLKLNVCMLYKSRMFESHYWIQEDGAEFLIDSDSIEKFITKQEYIKHKLSEEEKDE